ncbi:enkurin isoform X2 [Thalassophryne amazonica]|uniref:enkurin isoform X2 n=1 Tax=Thalassophryne amazonica TaxID=390379 RepID=UPI001471892E|nr:enkurin isoform X2 [Thalassophryne amazonica]
MADSVSPPGNIYSHLISTEEPQVKNRTMYQSKFRTSVVAESKLNKDTKKTMGPAKVEVPAPDKFLKKHSKESRPLKEVDHDTCTMKKPAVPLRADRPLMGQQRNTDFIKTNKTIPLMTQKLKPAFTDTSRGHKQRLEDSGLVPKYIKKKDFGEIPEYLQHFNEEVQRAQEEYDNYVKEQKEKGAMKCLSAEERQTILEDLKMKWEELHHEYQGLPVVIDTPRKKSQKERLDAAMNQLEKDINLFETFKTIYISSQ